MVLTSWLLDEIDPLEFLDAPSACLDTTGDLQHHGPHGGALVLRVSLYS